MTFRFPDIVSRTVRIANHHAEAAQTACNPTTPTIPWIVWTSTTWKQSPDESKQHIRESFAYLLSKYDISSSRPLPSVYRRIVYISAYWLVSTKNALYVVSLLVVDCARGHRDADFAPAFWPTWRRGAQLARLHRPQLRRRAHAERQAGAHGRRRQRRLRGVPYNFPGRGDQTIGTKYTHKVLPEDIANDNVSVCQYHAQDANYTGWRKAVEAKAGDKLYFAYFSNGHVVKDKAGLGTTHGVYWAGRPGVELEKPSQLTKEYLVDGQLHDFDDGNCGQSFVDGNFAGGTVSSGRAGDFKPCIGSFTIPTNTKAGTYPMVWWWTFFKADDVKNGFRNFEGAGGAAYSSCFNVIIKDTSGVIKEEAAVQAKCGVASDGDNPKEDPEPEVPDAKTTSSDQQNPVASEQNLTPTPTPSSPAPSPTTPTPSLPTPSTPAPTPSTPTPASTTPTPTPSVSTTPAPTLVASPTPTPTPTTSAPTVTSTPAPTPPPTTAAPTPFVASNIFAAPLSAITISGVGGKGSCGKVTNMACPGTPSTCEQTAAEVSGPLAPFDEDLTLALRGPLEVDDIVVFTRSDSSQWSKVSSYSKTQSSATQNMVFLNNKGDPEKSGEFSMCHGNSQSFASSSTAFGGVLGDGVEVNVMSEITCAALGTCGFSHGVAHEGWRGEHKIFVVKAQMPHATQEAAKDLPAIWLLNGQVVRAAEYGCNCRGVGDQGPWKGGCGELDVAEVIPENKEMLTSTIYSFKGSRGISPVVARPTDGRVVFVVIFSADSTGSGATGTVQILMMRPDNVDIENAPSAQRVDEWLAYRNGQQVDFHI